MKRTTLSLALGSALLLAVTSAAFGQRAGAGGTAQSGAGAGGTGQGTIQSGALAGGTGQRTTGAPSGGSGAGSSSAPTTQGASEFSDPLGPGGHVPFGRGFRTR